MMVTNAAPNDVRPLGTAFHLRTGLRRSGWAGAVRTVCNPLTGVPPAGCIARIVASPVLLSIVTIDAAIKPRAEAGVTTHCTFVRSFLR